MSEIRVGIKLNEQQGKAFEILTENDDVKAILFGGAAGGGKSALSCLWLIVMCNFYYETRWFVGREELKRIRESWLPTFYKLLKIYNIPSNHWRYNGQDHYLQHYRGGRIDLLDLKYLPSDPMYERYGSIEYTCGVIEEGGETNFGAFDVLKTRVGRYNNEKYGISSKILITSNPKKNWLKTTFINPFRAGKLQSQYAYVPAFAHQNQFLDKGYLDNLDNITDPVTKARLRDGDWDYADDTNQLMSFDKISDIFTNEFVKPGEKAITADIARFGKDKTTIGRWSGLRLEEVETIDKSSIPDAAKVIRAIATVHGIPMSNVVVDEDGVGGGVKDILNCRGFVNNARPIEVKGKDCNYANLKSQCSFLLSEDVNNSLVYVNCKHEAVKNMIIEELEQVKDASVDTDGKKAVVSKDKVKDAIGRSPDYADMMIMRKYLDLPHVSKITGWR